MTRALACIIYALFPGCEQEKKQFDSAMEELENTIKSKKFTDVKAAGSFTINIIENQLKHLQCTKQNVCAIIRLFYAESYLSTLEDVWTLEM